MTEETREMFRAVTLAKDSNVLYCSGGWVDQPEWFIEAYELYRHEVIKWERDKASKSSSAQKTRQPTS